MPRKKASAKKDRKALPRVRTASASKKFATADILQIYSNPSYTDQELEYFEDAWAASVVGTAIDKLMDFTMGGGVKPTFELVDDTGMDEEQQKKELAKYDKELNELIHFDKHIGFEKKLKDAATMAKVFGRCVMTWEGKGLPEALKIIHPRDTGRVFIDQKTWGLEKVITTYPSDEIYPDDMIYFVNRPFSPLRRTMWYGYSDMQRVVGAARAWRRIIEWDMPEIATAMWANYGMFILKKMGRDKADAQIDATTLLDSLKPGSFNCVTTDALDEIEFKPLDLNPKIKELVDLASFYERILIGNWAVPSALLGREEDQNRATLIGKIQFFLAGPVKSTREWLSDMISQQWYERNMKHMGMADLLKKVKVRAEFESVVVESWFDLVDAVLRLKGVLPNLPDEKVLELLNLEDLKDSMRNAEPINPNFPQPTGLHGPEDIMQKQLNKTMNQTDTIAATRDIDNDLINQAINVKKAKILDDLDHLIQNEKQHAQNHPGSD